MAKSANVSPKDIGYKRLYQPWAALPAFNASYGEWLHSYEVPLGNPCSSARECRQVLDAWLKKHKKRIARLNKEVERSGRVGSRDTRVIARVYQIWPRTQNTPGEGMFQQVVKDPFEMD
jgi:hypothetical protein